MITMDGVPAATQPASSLKVLAEALGGETLPPAARVCAAASAQSPEEGLALLSAYVSIAPAPLRQAILDVVVALANRSAGAGH